MKKIGSIGSPIRIAAGIGLAVLLGAAAAPAAEKAAGPAADFRSWTHTKSMVIVDRSNGLYGMHNVYANSIALRTLKEGGTYGEGAEFAVSFHELETKDGGTTQGRKIKVGFMRKDEKAAKTDGWIYSALGPDGMPDDRTAWRGRPGAAQPSRPEQPVRAGPDPLGKRLSHS